MKKEKEHNSSNLDVNNGEGAKKKERHIVSWSEEEDDILREQIRLHGSDNWAIIASKFKDKTTRQCRRRWFTYLNSDFKKGGWSPEEDILLCEAQRMYGNRWTEIAKVVSGRTDNAVKNRFTTLCKKKAKREALSKVNSISSYFNLNNKRVISRNVINSDKRPCVSSITEIPNQGENPGGECAAADYPLGHPFAETAGNVQSFEINIKEELTDPSMENRCLSTFLDKDNPKGLALMQQADHLSSLVIKVDTDFLKNKESRQNGDTEFQLEKFKESEEDLRSCVEGSRSSWRELNVYESSPASSEYSTGSTLVPKKDECYVKIAALTPETGHVSQAEKLDQPRLSEEKGVCQMATTNEVKSMPEYDDVKPNSGVECEYHNAEFSSPTHVTPLFRTLAAAIPSPKFSESEKHFLMKTLGLESTSPSPITNSLQPPPCKRSLLHCL